MGTRTLPRTKLWDNFLAMGMCSDTCVFEGMVKQLIYISNFIIIIFLIYISSYLVI